MLRTLLDMILLPEEVFKKLSSSGKGFLYASIILIGIFDFLSVYGLEEAIAFLSGSKAGLLVWNLLIILIGGCVMGIVDVLVFCIPLDYFFRKVPELVGIGTQKSNLLLFSKVYVYSHFPIILINLFLKLLYYGKPDPVNGWYFLLLIVIMLWFTFIIGKGTCIVYKVPLEKQIIPYFAIFFWMNFPAEVVVWIEKLVVLCLR